jgi:hypothetical protein
MLFTHIAEVKQERTPATTRTLPKLRLNTVQFGITELRNELKARLIGATSEPLTVSVKWDWCNRLAAIRSAVEENKEFVREHLAWALDTIRTLKAELDPAANIAEMPSPEEERIAEYLNRTFYCNRQ